MNLKIYFIPLVIGTLFISQGHTQSLKNTESKLDIDQNYPCNNDQCDEVPVSECDMEECSISRINPEKYESHSNHGYEDDIEVTLVVPCEEQTADTKACYHLPESMSVVDEYVDHHCKVTIYKSGSVSMQDERTDEMCHVPLPDEYNFGSKELSRDQKGDCTIIKYISKDGLEYERTFYCDD